MIINEAGSTSFQNSILAGQWFAMKADMFIFVILNKLKACWKSGEMKKGQEDPSPDELSKHIPQGPCCDSSGQFQLTHSSHSYFKLFVVEIII